MTGTLSIAPIQPGESVRPLSHSQENDSHWLAKSIQHTVRKAQYKIQDNQQLVRVGWHNRIRRFIEGNTADERYRRSAYESSQRNTSALMAESYRAQMLGTSPENADLSNNTLIKNRFYRQDNLRFNPQMRKAAYGLSKRDSWAVRLSRWAHHANGVTELGAAPTGMLLKSSRHALTPGGDDRTLGSQVRVMGALGGISAITGFFSLFVFKEGIGKVTNKVAASIRGDIKFLVASFSAVSAVSAIISLALGGASAACGSQSKLSATIMDLLSHNKEKHVDRLHILLADALDKPGAQTILARALCAKIGPEYCCGEQPVLLQRLLQDIEGSSGDADLAKQRMQHTLGAYQVEKDFTGKANGQLLDEKTDQAELLRRENQVVALTNLIEHSSIDGEESDNYKDVRHRFEDGIKATRKGALWATGNLLGVLGFQNASKKVLHLRSDAYLDEYKKSKADPANAWSTRLNADVILDNPHRYGRVTRALALMSEIVRVGNHGILLSLNYQLTRPFAWLAGRVTEHMLQRPNSRVTSFSIGRAISSSVWAAIDSFLFISLAGGHGVGLNGPESPTTVTFPLQVPLGFVSLPISIINTAAQMLLVSVPSFALMVAARVACSAEGWKGDIVRPLDASSSKRKPLQWD